MDPNAALEAARAQASLIVGRHEAGEEVETGHVELLVENFQALDEWLTKGGFAPAAWPLAAMAKPPTPEEEHKCDLSQRPTAVGQEFTCSCSQRYWAYDVHADQSIPAWAKSRVPRGYLVWAPDTSKQQVLDERPLNRA